MKADRGLPDILDDIENILTFLLPDSVAEQAPQEPDILAQRRVLTVFNLGVQTSLIGHRDLTSSNDVRLSRGRAVSHRPLFASATF